MIGLKGSTRKKKRGGKGVVYMTESQSRPQLRVGKRTLWDPKITWYENGWIRVRKHDKYAYGVIIMYLPRTLPFANKLISTVNGDTKGNKTILVRGRGT
jgi:hypothetical protein